MLVRLNPGGVYLPRGGEILVVRPVSGVPLCFAWGGIVATSVGLPTSAVFTRVIGTATNIRGVDAAGAVLPAS